MIFYGSKIVWDNSTMEWNFFITTVFKCQQGMRQQDKKKKNSIPNIFCENRYNSYLKSQNI